MALDNTLENSTRSRPLATHTSCSSANYQLTRKPPTADLRKRHRNERIIELLLLEHLLRQVIPPRELYLVTFGQILGLLDTLVKLDSVPEERAECEWEPFKSCGMYVLVTQPGRE
jgi:hypothetical protein